MIQLFINTQAFWIGAASSFVGSMILILSLFIFAKPKFKISKEICFINTDAYGVDLKGSYLIKVQNRSLFSAFELKGNLEKLEPYQVKKGTNFRAFDIVLVDPTTNVLARRNPFKNDGKNAFLFRTTTDLHKVLSEKGFKLRFTIVARNSFSGLVDLFREEYDISADIKNGNFGFGKDFAIK